MSNFYVYWEIYDHQVLKEQKQLGDTNEKESLNDQLL